MKHLAIVQPEGTTATPTNLGAVQAQDPTLKRAVGFDCLCGKGMVWLKGHAVCEGCREHRPSCVCNGEPTRLLRRQT